MGVGIGHLFSEFPTNTMQAKLIFLSCKIHFTGQFCDSSFVLIFKEELIFSEFLPISEKGTSTTGGAKLLFGKKFAENCMKVKEIRPEGRQVWSTAL